MDLICFPNLCNTHCFNIFSNYKHFIKHTKITIISEPFEFAVKCMMVVKTDFLIGEKILISRNDDKMHGLPLFKNMPSPY